MSENQDTRWRVALSILAGFLVACLVGSLAFAFLNHGWAWVIFAVTWVVAAILYAPHIKT
jgi:uncharacterized membrane protein YgaE (UPF0421/DUF939 family)